MFPNCMFDVERIGLAVCRAQPYTVSSFSYGPPRLVKGSGHTIWQKTWRLAPKIYTDRFFKQSSPSMTLDSGCLQTNTDLCTLCASLSTDHLSFEEYASMKRYLDIYPPEHMPQSLAFDRYSGALSQNWYVTTLGITV